jgi:hypothetical protein
MPSNRRPSLASNTTHAGLDSVTDRKEIVADLADYLTDYARQNPGYAALWCLGIGFVLGWKLKPW